MTSGKMVKLPVVSSVSFFVAVYPVTQYPPFQPIHLDSQNLRPGQIIERYGELQFHTQTGHWRFEPDRQESTQIGRSFRKKIPDRNHDVLNEERV